MQSVLRGVASARSVSAICQPPGIMMTGCWTLEIIVRADLGRGYLGGAGGVFRSAVWPLRRRDYAFRGAVGAGWAGFCRSRCNGPRRRICRFLRFVGIERNGLWAGPAPRLLGLAKFGRRPASPDFEVGLAGHVESPLRPRFALKIRAAPLLWCRSSSFSVHVGRTTWLFRDMQLSVCQQIERNHRCWRWLGLRCSS